MRPDNCMKCSHCQTCTIKFDTVTECPLYEDRHHRIYKLLIALALILGFLCGTVSTAIVLNNYAIAIPTNDIPGYRFDYGGIEYQIIVRGIKGENNVR